MNLANKHIIVTGAGSGIGRALTLGLVKRGAIVSAIDMNDASLQETKSLASDAVDSVSTYVANITDHEAIQRVIEQIHTNQGEIDGVINNAGIIQPFLRVADLSYSDIDRVMQVNFFGTLFITKSLLPTLRARPEAYIVNVSSMGGFLPVPGQSVYGASKAAVKLLTEGLGAELKDTNVHVSVVFPGATNTNITKNSGVKQPGDAQNSAAAALMTTADAAAETIIRGMERNKRRIFIGKDSKILDLLYRIAPNFATNLIAKQMKSLLDV